MADRDIAEGQTALVRYVLRRQGGAVINLSAVNKIRLALTSMNGEGPTTTYETTDASPKIQITDAANGEVGFNPTDLTAQASPYIVRFWVYLTASEREPAPPDTSERLVVYPNYGA